MNQAEVNQAVVTNAKRAASSLWGNTLGSMWGGILGKNNLNPSYYKINEAASERDRALAHGARGMQAGLANRLIDTMEGRGPSVAELQARQGVSQAVQGIGQQAASARGVSRGLAMRSAMLGGAQTAQAANRDASLLRAQEQLSARGQYADTAGAMRSGDLQTRQQDIDIEKGNQGSWGQQESQRTAISEGNANRKQKGYGAILSSVGGAIKGLFSDVRLKEDVQPITFAERLGAALGPGSETARAFGQSSSSGAQQFAAQPVPDSNKLEPYQIPKDSGEQIQPNKESAGMPGIGGAIGGGIESFGNGLMSDERAKTGIDRIDSKRELASVAPYSFSYAPGVAARIAEDAAMSAPPEQRDKARAAAYADARAPRAGIMAQDLERTSEGDEVVKDTPVGKMLDGKRSIAFALANIADMNRRLGKLETKRAK